MMSSSFTLKYKVLEKIGEGSFSEVLKCKNRITEELFAAKRLKKCYRNRQEVYECPEIVAMRKIPRHPNILYIIETHYEQLLGRVTLIFELLDMSLYDYMKVRKRPIPEVKAKHYLHQLLKGLHHLHKNGIFHRDVKPENILMKINKNSMNNTLKEEIIKLGDFGSIRGIYSKPPYTEYISTRWYRPPECLLTNGCYNSKMDIWAAGCVFFEMLTLKPLFPGSDEIDQIHKINQILGTPTPYTLNKFRQNKRHNFEYTFSTIKGIDFKCLIFNCTNEVYELLTYMLVYDPDYRYNCRQLLNHRYFKEFKEELSWRKQSVPSVSKLRTSSNLSFNDYSTIKLSETLKNSSDKNKDKLPPETCSEIISNVPNRTLDLLKSRSDSVNLNSFLKKSRMGTEIKTETFTRHTNLNKPIHKSLMHNKTLNNHKSITTKLRNIHKNSSIESTNYTKIKSHSIEKVPCGADSYFQLLNKIKPLPPKKLSEPGLLNDKTMAGKSIVSKPLLLSQRINQKQKFTESKMTFPQIKNNKLLRRF